METIARTALFLDVIGITILVVFIWLDLRRQTSDFGKVGSVTVLILLCCVLYFVGRAFFSL